MILIAQNAPKEVGEFVDDLRLTLALTLEISSQTCVLSSCNSVVVVVIMGNKHGSRDDEGNTASSSSSSKGGGVERQSAASKLRQVMPQKATPTTTPTAPFPNPMLLGDDCDRPACDDVANQMKQMLLKSSQQQLQQQGSSSSSSSSSSSTTDDKKRPFIVECPPKSGEIGYGSWTLLHSMVGFRSFLAVYLFEHVVSTFFLFSFSHTRVALLSSNIVPHSHPKTRHTRMHTHTLNTHTRTFLIIIITMCCTTTLISYTHALNTRTHIQFTNNRQLGIPINQRRKIKNT